MKQIHKVGFASCLALIFFLSCCSSNRPEWDSINRDLIKQHNLAERSLDLPSSPVQSNLAAAKVQRMDSLGSIGLAPGVRANVSWGTGVLIATLYLDADATIGEEQLPSDRFLFVLEGDIQQSVDGENLQMRSIKREAPDGTHSATPRTDFLYMQKGARSAIRAGESGAKLLEVYSPVRLDYMQKAGVQALPTTLEDVEQFQVPNVEFNKVYDLNDLQLTELAAGANSRLVSGRNMQMSFISMDPNSTFPHHIHPEEQIMIALRGGCEEILLDKKQSMKAGDIVRIPSNMVHGAEIGDIGCDALDIFWPARPDYLEKEKQRVAAFREIIPAESDLELVVDGKKTKPELNFSEGPKWLNGKIYFSNMYFDAGWNADPKKSSTVELDPDGSYKNISVGRMQTNGLYPYRNGNLIVCDMMGHRVVELTTKGNVVRVLADKYEGKPLDGPNDVVTDSKGGFYFTDPQFTMEPKKFQPGRAVYYVSPEGKVIRLTGPNEFAMPNGILLSPDGKTLYVNNCYDDESWFPVNSEKDNFIWAYDVNDNGTISNGRKFAQLFLTGDVLDRKGRSSSADGMAIDKDGNLYVATYYGVQIFNSSGQFVGMINLPSFPVSLCFGDTDMKSLYIVSYSKIYRIRTNKEGYINYL